MKITESKLKSIIRQVIKESVHDLAELHPELHDVEPVAPLSSEEKARMHRNEALGLADMLNLLDSAGSVDQIQLKRAISRLSLLLQKR